MLLTGRLNCLEAIVELLRVLGGSVGSPVSPFGMSDARSRC